MPPVIRHASGALDFRDSQGALWTVSEIAYMEFSEKLTAMLPHPERRAGWLLFEASSGERRRLTPIPEGWQNLPAPVLEQCLSKAVRASSQENRRRSDDIR